MTGVQTCALPISLVPSTRKPTQPTEPTLATGGRHQKQWELQTCSLRKGDPKHSKLGKMGRQRNTQDMKKQGKNPPGQTNEEEIGSLPEKELKTVSETSGTTLNAPTFEL